MERQQDFEVQRLGECTVLSPMKGIRFTNDDHGVLLHSNLDVIRQYLQSNEEPPRFESAGPRQRIYFDPHKLVCGIVTCGGLSPGLNDVIRAIVLSLHHHYAVKNIFGFPYGYEGLEPKCGHTPIELTPSIVGNIHETGGSILGSSRGDQQVTNMVDTLQRMKISILFTIGGDGTQRGALAISDEARRRGLNLSVIGIPKTIDNDVSYVQKTFGFETAVAEAERVIHAANVEANGAPKGVGLVKLMGRDSGFIAAFAALVSGQANFCLIPEIPFTLNRFLAELKKRLDERGHAVIVVAEGAGQNLLQATGEKDASGNIRYGDVGVFLRDQIQSHFKKAGWQLNLKYIDPSYTIRSLPANSHDSALCLLFGHNAVHAGMAGRTGMMIGYWNHQFTHVPIPLAVSARKKIDPTGWIWSSVIAATGQSELID